MNRLIAPLLTLLLAVGAAEVARSQPDGHMPPVTAAAFVIAPAVFKAPGDDPVKDFTGVAQGTPPAEVARLNAAFGKALARPDIRVRIVNGGSLPIDPPLAPAQWSAQAAREVAQWAELVRTVGLKAE